MDDSKGDMFNEEYLESLFSDCVDAGASFEEKGGVYTLRFPETDLDSPHPDGFSFSFSLDDSEGQVLIECDIPQMRGELSVDDFLNGVDIISAKLLSLFDGIDRLQG